MKRKADFIMQNVGGENVLVPLGGQVKDMNGIFTLNDTGSCIWELLVQERTVDELAIVVAERFDVIAEIAYADVQIFIDNIAKLGLLEP